MKKLKKTIVVIAALTSVFAATSVQAQHRFNLDSLDMHSLTYRAEEGEVFRVEIRGDGKSDVDLRVKSPSGRLMCDKTGMTDRELCTIRALRSGEYTIEVDNMDLSPNRMWLWLD